MKLLKTVFRKPISNNTKIPASKRVRQEGLEGVVDGNLDRNVDAASTNKIPTLPLVFGSCVASFNRICCGGDESSCCICLLLCLKGGD